MLNQKSVASATVQVSYADVTALSKFALVAGDFSADIVWSMFKFLSHASGGLIVAMSNL